MIKKTWDEASVMRRTRSSDGAAPLLISDTDKTTGRQALLETLMAEPDTSIRSLLAECVNLIAYNDYPDKWPQLLPSLAANVQVRERAWVGAHQRCATHR